MDKQAFLSQLESAVKNNDKSLFIETIFDLPFSIIVSFTEDETSKILYLSKKVNLQNVHELFTFLNNEGLFFQQNALEGVDELNNFLLSKFYFNLCICFFSGKEDKIKFVLEEAVISYCRLAEIGVESRNNFEKAISLCIESRELFPHKSANYAEALMHEGNARQGLADMDVDAEYNLKKALSLYSEAQSIFSKADTNYAGALVNEGNARQVLADMGIEVKKNLKKALFLYERARSIHSKKEPFYAFVLINESSARIKLAKMGTASINNFKKVVSLCSEARKCLPINSSNYAIALMNEAIARQGLADLGIDVRGNIEEAISLYVEARSTLLEISTSFAVALINEGISRQKLADIGVESKENYEKSLLFCTKAQRILPKKGTEYARALMNEAISRHKLAEMGVSSKENLEKAAFLYSEALKIFPTGSIDFALTLMNEGALMYALADIGVSSKENLEKSILLYNKAQKMFPYGSDYACALMNEGVARQCLVEMGASDSEYIEKSISLYSQAREIFSKNSSSYARALTNEGTAKQTLANMGIQIDKNLKEAILLHSEAQKIFPKTSEGYAIALMNEGTAREWLVYNGLSSEEELQKSKALYLEGISIFENLENGWHYSTAFLKLNALLIGNYYRTGDKTFLEEGKNVSESAWESIKSRELKYKNILLATLHEIRASLFEFEGKSGINKASREYAKAYGLTEILFYKFMDEFCQARVATKSFCELIYKWKEAEKEGIFLDYYNYAIFECHLEKALKNTIDEEDELKLAVKKLKEIRDRTQIKIMKDRVSAYIYLMQSLVDCFNKDSYEAAADNVRKGCKIFREYGDRQGQETCNIFYNAVVKKRDPVAWQEIIKNRVLSSNFYSLLCEYADRKRANLESQKLDQIYGTVSRTEEKVDKIQATLNQGFSEIKDQIEDGFNGTVSELRGIKGEINSIQRDLEGLLQVSNEINSKEGERVREFVIQMVALMKKGDSEALNRFLEEVVQKESSFVELIENSDAPEKDKEEAKSKLSGFKKVAESVNEKIKSFGKNVTNEIIVDMTAGEIIKLLTPMMSMAAFGVPIPSQVVEILATVTKGLAK